MALMRAQAATPGGVRAGAPPPPARKAYDVAVVGGGLLGLSAAQALAKRSKKVPLFLQAVPPSRKQTVHSSSGSLVVHA